MMDWGERENIRKRGPLLEPFRKNSALCGWQANQSWFKERRNSQVPDGSARENKKKANAAPQADPGLRARGAHGGESCTGTDVDTGGSSSTKSLLSPGGTPQDAQSQVKCTKKPSVAQQKRLRKQTEAPYNS